MLANTLQIALERLDRLWTGYYLGTTPLGFYSRAHAFAGFARTVSSGSVSAVAGGIFAELIGSRRRLSQAFSRTVALVVRGGFLLGGLVLVVTPEFIRLVLGPKWLPMLDVLRLAVVFAMIEPVRTLAVILFVVLGRPQTVVRLQLLQLTALLPGLFVLGLPLGASGVALALDAALLLGTVIGLRHARTHVDFSPWRLFAAPAMALVAGLTLGGLAGTVPAVGGSDWRSAAVKATVYCALYGAILGTLERQRVSELVAAFTDCMTAGGARQPSGLAAPDA
jgi:O-antigen/teichoic acid export membrane protein